MSGGSLRCWLCVEERRGFSTSWHGSSSRCCCRCLWAGCCAQKAVCSCRVGLLKADEQPLSTPPTNSKLLSLLASASQRNKCTVVLWFTSNSVAVQLRTASCLKQHGKVRTPVNDVCKITCCVAWWRAVLAKAACSWRVEVIMLPLAAAPTPTHHQQAS